MGVDEAGRDHAGGNLEVRLSWRPAASHLRDALARHQQPARARGSVRNNDRPGRQQQFGS
jgi:hypothetical protein